MDNIEITAVAATMSQDVVVLRINAIIKPVTTAPSGSSLFLFSIRPSRTSTTTHIPTAITPFRTPFISCDPAEAKIRQAIIAAIT
ncbi:hypothetical protein D3C85_1163860 [compost metagenome]